MIKAIAFSVDDAYSSFYDIYWPVFRKNNIPVTLFVSTDIIDKKTKGYMTWDDLSLNLLMKVVVLDIHTSSHLQKMKVKSLVIKNDIFNFIKAGLKILISYQNYLLIHMVKLVMQLLIFLKEFDISFGQHSGIKSL